MTKTPPKVHIAPRSPVPAEQLLGKDGVSVVWADDTVEKDRTVALKLLPEGESHDPVFRARLQRERMRPGDCRNRTSCRSTTTARSTECCSSTCE